MGNIYIFETQPDCLCHWSGEPGGGGVHCGVRAQGAPGGGAHHPGQVLQGVRQADGDSLPAPARLLCRGLHHCAALQGGKSSREQHCGDRSVMYHVIIIIARYIEPFKV